MLARTALFWFRRDLRLSDNPGLSAAAQYDQVVPIYILDQLVEQAYPQGSASCWWLHHSLQALNHSLENKLNFYVGSTLELILQLSAKYQVTGVFFNRCYEPAQIELEQVLSAELATRNIACYSFNSSLLWEPWQITKADQTPYKVFTPYYKNGCLQAPAPRKPLTPPKTLKLFYEENNPQNLASLKLISAQTWHEKLSAHWSIGEAAAQSKAKQFLAADLKDYKTGRDYPELASTSRLSPHLHFGEISPQQLWYALERKKSTARTQEDIEHFKRELAWREFSYHLLDQFPELATKNFQAKFANFPWQDNPKLLAAWQRGQTGYPIVDAGMRELWQTGYMHNRVRMITASFLVKNLLISWQQGSRWFWECLLDADLANNSASWQWVAGSGADAAPYFRIFNPVTQGEKFDINGAYTRQYVPELKYLPNKYLFKPWEAPSSVLSQAHVVLGQTYPLPIVDLAASRQQALAAYAKVRETLTK